MNGNRIGEVDGKGVLQAGFSPDEKFFTFLTTGICGALCQNFSLYVLDLSTRKLTLIKSPFKSTDKTFVFIESFSWTSEDDIDVIVYSAQSDNENKYGFARTSPEQVWRYSISTGTYKFIKNLPD